MGRMLVLIKACLSNLLVYCILLFKMLKAAVERLDRIQRKFLWECQESGAARIFFQRGQAMVDDKEKKI